MTTNTLQADAALQQASQQLGIGLSPEQISLLVAYMDWLQKWNRVYNLTSLRDPADMLTHHLMDSLTAVLPLRKHIESLVNHDNAPATEAVNVLDVGSGGGLPGVVLAICCPQINVTCVDTVAKKAAFIQQVAASLRLTNLKGLHARVESIQGGFDVVTSRAFASLLDFATWSRAALKPQGVWMAMKGKHPGQELAALGANVEVFHVEPLRPPCLEDVERCMVWMRPV